MRKLNIEEYDLLFELTKDYILTSWDYRKKEVLRINIANLLNCEPKEVIGLVNRFYPEIYQQVTKPIKEELEKSFKGLYFSEIH